MVRIERAHSKTLEELKIGHDERMREIIDSLGGSHSSIMEVQSWLNYELDGVVKKSVKTVQMEVEQIKEKTKKTASKPRRPPTRRTRANRKSAATDLETAIKDLTRTVASLATDIHYIKQDLSGMGARNKLSEYSQIPDEEPKRREEPSYEDIKKELKAMRAETERMLSDVLRAKPVSKEEIGEEIKGATAAIINKTNRILEEVVEVKETTFTNMATNSANTTGLGTELAMADTAAQIQGFLNPIRADVAEMASASKELNRTMEWYNSSLKRGNKHNNTVPTLEPGRSYASVVKATPQNQPNHTIIISSTDPNNTGNKVLEDVTKALDFKNTGLKVDRVRKARNSKVLLSCHDKEDIIKIKHQINKNKNLKAHEPKPQNPLIKIRNVMSYLKDDEIIEHIRAQNKKLFQDLPGEEALLKIRYRKRTRNALQCHIILEVSPPLHKRMLDMGSVHIAIQKRDVEDQSPLVQCAKCLGFGHTKTMCKESSQYCNYCGGAHSWQECRTRQEDRPPTCKNCKEIKTQDIFPHVAFSEDCPQKQMWDRLARSKISYC
ncbi:uncharacterized protein LOC113402094 [Vanessa tameamea]|uniref:Uncharacterized protein LOC113402094 n=1 Tax=Vanessa tameamea TaxID=334116 RepID=A0ABM4AK15_VANTA